MFREVPPPSVTDPTVQALMRFARTAHEDADARLLSATSVLELRRVFANARYLGKGSDTLAVLHVPLRTDMAVRVCELGRESATRRPFVRAVLIGAEIQRLARASPANAAMFLVGAERFAIFRLSDATVHVGPATRKLAELGAANAPHVEFTDVLPPAAKGQAQREVLSARIGVSRAAKYSAEQLPLAYAETVAQHYSAGRRFSYYAMEAQRFARGTSLHDVLNDSESRVRAIRSLFVVLQQLALLQTAYGYVHTDLQSRNIVLDTSATVEAACRALLRTADNAPLDSTYCAGCPVLIDNDTCFLHSIGGTLRELNGPAGQGLSGAEDVRRLGLYALYSWYSQPPAANTAPLNSAADAALFVLAMNMAWLPQAWTAIATDPSRVALLMFGEWRPHHSTLLDFVKAYAALHELLRASYAAVHQLRVVEARVGADSALRLISTLLHDLNYYSAPINTAFADAKAVDRAAAAPAAVLVCARALVATVDHYGGAAPPRTPLPQGRRGLGGGSLGGGGLGGGGLGGGVLGGGVLGGGVVRGGNDGGIGGVAIGTGSGFGIGAGAGDVTMRL